MEQAILIIHVLIALAIIGLILIQQGKGADMGASFGAGASQTLFGSTGSGNVLTKSTAILVTLFFVTSFGLAILAKNHSASVGDIDFDVPAVIESEAPAANEIPAMEDGQGANDVEIPSMDMSAEDDTSTKGSDIPTM